MFPSLLAKVAEKEAVRTLINRFQLLKRAISIIHPLVDRLEASSGCIYKTSG